MNTSPVVKQPPKQPRLKPAHQSSHYRIKSFDYLDHKIHQNRKRDLAVDGPPLRMHRIHVICKSVMTLTFATKDWVRNQECFGSMGYETVDFEARYSQPISSEGGNHSQKEEHQKEHSHSDSEQTQDNNELAIDSLPPVSCGSPILSQSVDDTNTTTNTNREYNCGVTCFSQTSLCISTTSSRRSSGKSCSRSAGKKSSVFLARHFFGTPLSDYKNCNNDVGYVSASNCNSTSRIRNSSASSCTFSNNNRNNSSRSNSGKTHSRSKLQFTVSHQRRNHCHYQRGRQRALSQSSKGLSTKSPEKLRSLLIKTTLLVPNNCNNNSGGNEDK
eukprot:m.42091 g.42091  ORF g.42091 m.42091 type:complete len:329 (-) comp7037_c0_seq1:250-1236(-)